MLLELRVLVHGRRHLVSPDISTIRANRASVQYRYIPSRFCYENLYKWNAKHIILQEMICQRDVY